MTDKTGSIGAFMQQTKSIMAEPATAAGTPESSSKHATTADRAHAVSASALLETGIVEVLSIEDFTDADAEAVRRAAPSAEAKKFDDELTPDT